MQQESCKMDIHSKIYAQSTMYVHETNISKKNNYTYFIIEPKELKFFLKYPSNRDLHA